MKKPKIILNKNFVETYSKIFDENIYPYEPYEQIVWKHLKSKNKYSILGAWKTGSLRKQYKLGYKSAELNNLPLYYTGRWKNGTSAQMSAWEKLNTEYFRNKLIKVAEQSEFRRPAIFDEIIELKGIGFIYALFVLHCENPLLFPLYDQHVWRSYLYFNKMNYNSAKVASQSWASYCNYTLWFKDRIKELDGINPTNLDRALWKFGKEIKTRLKS